MSTGLLLVGTGVLWLVAAFLSPAGSGKAVAAAGTRLVGEFVEGVGIELFNVPWFTATQWEVEPRLLARVSSLDFLVSYGLALIAPAIDAFGTTAVLAACAAVCFAAPAVAALVPSARHLKSSAQPKQVSRS
ncbi:hypothetical protein ACFFRB_32905 [Kibdelosporangium aridum subsp. largum]|uniref:hypothetical protein n=1 Tax=Kibdelosporangium aridum TaxID=2030 RepID=UPI0035E87BD4